MALGDEIVRRTQTEIIQGSAKLPSTRKILRRCIPALKMAIDQIAVPETGYNALPGVYGRHVIFATPKRGAVADMLDWQDPVAELMSDDKADRAALWAAIANFVFKMDITGAFAALSTRLGPEGIAQFNASFERLDNVMGEVHFAGTPVGDVRLVSRGALFVFAGTYEGAAAGTIGALAVPVYIKPGPVADWHDEPDWSADGNHRWLN